MADGDGFVRENWSDCVARYNHFPPSAAPDDTCDCDRRCPTCGKLKPAGPHVTYSPQPRPLYWWEPGGSPSCGTVTVGLVSS